MWVDIGAELYLDIDQDVGINADIDTDIFTVYRFLHTEISIYI